MAVRHHTIPMGAFRSMRGQPRLEVHCDNNCNNISLSQQQAPEAAVHEAVTQLGWLASPGWHPDRGTVICKACSEADDLPSDETAKTGVVTAAVEQVISAQTALVAPQTTNIDLGDYLASKTAEHFSASASITGGILRPYVTREELDKLQAQLDLLGTVVAKALGPTYFKEVGGIPPEWAT
jgi:hypothetical protein